MAGRDILVYDDDTRVYLPLRSYFVGAALAQLRDTVPSDELRETGLDQGSMLLFSSRQKLLEEIDGRAPSDWAIALLDLEGGDRELRGGRIARTIREHPELRKRCLPAALTMLANPAITLALRDQCFASVRMGAEESIPDIADAIRAIAARHPCELEPRCAAFPQTVPVADWEQGFREGMRRALGDEIGMLGDDFILLHIAFAIDDSVTNLRLKRLTAGDGRASRPSVDAFKRAIADAQGWTLAVTSREIRRFMSTAARLHLDDPLNPGEILTAGAIWAVPGLRRQAFVPVELAPHLDAFFTQFRNEVQRRQLKAHNRKGHEEVYAICQATAEQAGDITGDQLEHMLKVLLDGLDEEPNALAPQRQGG